MLLELCQPGLPECNAEAEIQEEVTMLGLVTHYQWMLLELCQPGFPECNEQAEIQEVRDE